MSAEDNEMPAEFLLAAAAAALITGILSTAAAVIDEEEVNGTRDEAIDVACHVIASNLLQGCRKRQQNTELAVDEAIARENLSTLTEKGQGNVFPRTT
jgi:hypothetical protein